MKKLFIFFILLFVAANLTFAETADDEKLILQQRLLFSQNQKLLSSSSVADVWYKDADGDGYGDPTQGIVASFFYANYGYVLDHTDCDDSDSSIYPGATEIAGDGIDQDCDGEDDVFEAPFLTVTISGINVSLSWTSIQIATGYTLFYAPYPDASYIEQIDMGTETSISFDLWEGAAFYVAVKAYHSSGSSDYSNIEYFDPLFELDTWYQDNDGDGYGNSSVSLDSATQPSGYVADNTDCDDTDPTIHPGATEIAGDGIDQDCDGSDLAI